MDFEKYLHRTRKYKLRVPNPARYVDELRDELDKNLSVVEDWINGNINRNAMADTMHFFGTKYSAKGVTVYRGAKDLVFDSMPASYTKKLGLAEGFGLADVQKAWFFRAKQFYVIERVAGSNTLDLSKLLKRYASEEIPRGEEAEVIVYNTPVRNITEYSLEKNQDKD